MAADGHGEAESNDEGKQRQSSRVDDAEIVALVIFEGSPVSEKEGSEVCRDPSTIREIAETSNGEPVIVTQIAK